MREVSGSKNDSALAEVLKITPQALSNYKKKGKIPSSLVVRIAEVCDCSLDYLFKGEKPKEEFGVPKLDTALLDGTMTINQAIRAYHAIGLKFKEFELEPLTEVEKVQIDIQLGRRAKPPAPPISTIPEDESTEETPLKVAPDDTGEPSGDEKETEEPTPNALGSEETH